MQHNSSVNSSSVLFLLAVVFFSLLAQPQTASAQGKQKKPPRSAAAGAGGETRKLEQENDSKTGKNAQKTSNAVRQRKVMITDFDARSVARWWDGNWNIGSLFANSIIGPLSRTGTYDVVERARMNDVFDELKLSETERFSQAAVTKAGRLLGADYILFGFLTEFSRKKGGFGPYREISAQISFNARLVDVATGKVYKTAEINYVSPKKKVVSLSGEGEFNPNDPEFLQSLFGKAISETAGNLVFQLTGESITSTTPVITGGNSLSNSGGGGGSSGSSLTKAKVADVTGNTITINRGRQHGVKEGQYYAIVKWIKDILDPETGKVISQKTEEIARLKISKVDDVAAEGSLVSGDIKLIKNGAEVVRVDGKK